MINGIPSEKYYFLLEWKDANMKEFISIYGEKRLCDFTTYELNKLYQAIDAEEKQKQREIDREQRKIR